MKKAVIILSTIALLGCNQAAKNKPMQTVETEVQEAEAQEEEFLPYGQQNQLITNDSPFQSVFSDVKSGKFAGTANGVLQFKNSEGKSVLLDFQGSQSDLTLKADPDEVYDVSRKIYTARTTSGKTKIEYRTYASANELTIDYQGQVFQIGIIDGGCDMAIDGLSYAYMLEKETEYLVLTVKKELELSNIWFLRETMGYEDAVIGEKFIYLQPNSVIVFAIKR
jgi:hypothetical protein